MRRTAIAMVAALLGAGAGAAGWAVSDRLEQDNDFCNACHLEPERPLHEALRREFDARPAASLAAAHAAATVDGRHDPAFRCIDCHGGTGALGRLRVKVLAGKDAFWYGVGRFEEPDGMRWPLWDDDCRKCHAEFAGQSWQGWGPEPFHARSVHNTALGVDCVECHRAHGPGGAAGGYFLHAAHVRAQCARCHEEFKEEEYR
jgi:nitrate/TMAO reductase-like tetraheme cytochrome c subunit